VDLTHDDDADASLSSTLEAVASYERTYVTKKDEKRRLEEKNTTSMHTVLVSSLKCTTSMQNFLLQSLKAKNLKTPKA
jgi:hypothetical protein